MTLKDFKELIFRKKTTIAVCIALSLAGTFTSYFKSPKIYSATTTFFVFSGSKSFGGLALPSDIMAMLSSGGDMSASYIETLLNSDTLAWRVFQNTGLKTNKLFKLDEKTKASKNDRYNYLKLFKKRATVTKDPNGAYKITVKLDDPLLAARVANEMTKQLAIMVSEKTARHQKFVEQMLEKNKKDLAAAEKAYIDFGKNNDSVTLSGAPSSAVIDGMAKLEAQQAMNRISLDEAQSLSGVDVYMRQDVEREKIRLQERIASMNGEINSLEKRMQNIPAKQIEFFRVYRRLKMMEELNRMLNLDYESSVLKAEDEKTFQVIDEATPNMKAISPRKRNSAIFGLVYGLFFSFVLIALDEIRKRAA